MRKFRCLVLMCAAIIFLFSGCSKTDCSTIIPDIKSYFPNAEIAISSRYDAEKDYFVTVKGYQGDEYDKYIEACKRGKFTEVESEGCEKQTNYFKARTSDGQYLISIQLYKEKQSIYINCYKPTKKTDSESVPSSSGNAPTVECKSFFPDVKSFFPDATIYWRTGNPKTEYFVTVTDYSDGEYAKYIEACKAKGYTDVNFEYVTERGAGFQAFSEDGHYLVNIQLYKENEKDEIYIGCYKHEKEK